ncbi:DNA helicase RecQ [Runella aurantiaca]|uniref:DNA helicase RecQ n=1 Tax=Runella aurantiaca TaxID=2282308 RepID=A0A369IFU7_9BACT|nr:DNA helicase RecQ [Runella aurantiaca]RDB07085.1 DNA helicase RecQ [Runella aurantiaca]
MLLSKEQILKQYFGYDTFRPLQSEIIDWIAAGNDCMVLMPTGGGKSVCFQVPALMKEGITLVISPLIALMKDQVQALRANGIEAAFLNSTQSTAEQYAIEKQCHAGELKLLYIAPEKLFASGSLDFIRSLKINLFAIDESHCVSVWGHDFRPEYTQLHILKAAFPDVPMVALTATADRVTRRDVLKQLGIPEARVFEASFDRPNLSLNVLPGRNRIKVIEQFINDHPNQSGIIYCLARKTTEDIAQKLRAKGINARHYHAKLPAEERSKVQDDFLRDDIQIMVATIAFGMGIDKSNVRWIMHYNMPSNVESFYQEIGRAGRDGLKSDTMLFYSFADWMMRRDMIASSELPQHLKDIQFAKLDRMKQYAEADHCRRRILLSYFNEAVDRDCGNCDVCRNPRSKFDATLPAQKALSAIARTDQRIAMGLLIDVLRGSHNRNVTERGYDRIKTFGAGRELRAEEWADYLTQMLNSGVMDVAYDEAHSLKLNETSWQVLRGERKVQLVRFESYEEKRKRQEETAEPVKTKKEVIRDELFERLRKVRKRLSDENNIPPTMIFSDATLSDMAEKRPINRIQMLQISGMIQTKLAHYGEAFINEILEYARSKTQPGTRIVNGMTYIETHDLYKQGLTPSQIAQRRNLNELTVYSHLAKLYEDGYEVDVWQYLTKNEYRTITEAADLLQVTPGAALKPLFEQLEGQYEYYKLRIALAIWGKEK